MARIVPILVLVTALALGCGDPSTPPDAGQPRVALVMKSLANEFFKTMEDGARAHQAAEGGYELLAMGIKDELDVAGQIRLVEQAISMGVDALVIAPADSKALVSVCQRAQEAGMVVVNIDNQFDAAVLEERGMTVPFVGPDNAAGARRVGEHLATKLDAGAKVAILEGAPNAFNAVERKRGFQEAMDAAGIEVVASQSANWETSKANQVAAALITEIPDLDAILCANDSMALGAVAALKAAGKTGEVAVVGYDNISAVRELLADGRVLATADQHAGALAVFGIEHALEMLKTPTARQTPANRETPVDLVTAESSGAESPAP
ncbi:MAG: sugar ABC transporter substrate-binding protein [bacterium]|nr:sugar ABC transporter substrate-binding protein [bacterium]